MSHLKLEEAASLGVVLSPLDPVEVIRLVEKIGRLDVEFAVEKEELETPVDNGILVDSVTPVPVE